MVASSIGRSNILLIHWHNTISRTYKGEHTLGTASAHTIGIQSAQPPAALHPCHCNSDQHLHNIGTCKPFAQDTIGTAPSAQHIIGTTYHRHNILSAQHTIGTTYHRHYIPSALHTIGTTYYRHYILSAHHTCDTAHYWHYVHDTIPIFRRQMQDLPLQ